MILAGRGFQGVSTALRLGAGWCLNRAADCAIVAMRWRRPMLAGVIAVPMLAWAAPPPVGSEDWEILHPHAEWIRGLQIEGVLCCSIADGRPVEARSRAGIWQVRWRVGQLDGAPTEWTDVPAEVVMKMHNPIGMPVAFWWGQQIKCFIPPGGV